MAIGILLILDEFSSTRPTLCGPKVFDYLIKQFDSFCSVNQALAIKLISTASQNIELDLSSLMEKIDRVFELKRSAQMVDIYLYEQAASILLSKNEKQRIFNILASSKENAARALLIEMDNDRE